jgi:hypothetical protein
LKVQIRDINTWVLLAEADLTGKKFSAVGDRLLSDEEISMAVIANGMAMPDAFLVGDDGRVIRLLSFDSPATTIGPGYTITIPAGNLKWGR